jgi:hypothetical protein
MPSNDYVSYVKSILSTGPKLSSDISNEISEKFSIRKEYARTVLSRMNSTNEIYHTGFLLFKDGQRGYSLSSDPRSFESLLVHKPKLKNAVELLKFNMFIPKVVLLKITGVLNMENTNYYDIKKLLSDLSFFFPNISYFEADGTIFYTTTRQINSTNFHDYNEQNRTNEKLNLRIMDLKILPFIISYCKKINLIGNKARYVPIDLPYGWIETRAQLAFDAVSYTKIGNINSKSTICVFDVSFNNYYESQYEGFKHRYQTLINSGKIFQQRVIPIIAVDKIQHHLENRIKKENEAVLLKLNNIFGSRISRFLEIMSAYQLGSLADVSELLQIIKSTKNAKQLVRFIPFGFELIVNITLNHIFQNNKPPFSLKQKVLKIGNKSKQIDGYFEDDQSIYIVESKLYKSKIVWEKLNSKGKIQDYCLKYFFMNKYEFIKEWCEVNNKNKIIKMCFVSSNGFWQIEEGMNTIYSQIHSMGDLSLTVSLEDLISYAKNNSITIKELSDWVEMYYSDDSDDLEEYISSKSEDGMNEVELDPPTDDLL